MARAFTIEEMVPKAIQDLKMIDMELQNKTINEYQVGLLLSSVIHKLEHPEDYLDDGSVRYR